MEIDEIPTMKKIVTVSVPKIPKKLLEVNAMMTITTANNNNYKQVTS